MVLLCYTYKVSVCDVFVFNPLKWACSEKTTRIRFTSGVVFKSIRISDYAIFQSSQIRISLTPLAISSGIKSFLILFLKFIGFSYFTLVGILSEIKTCFEKLLIHLLACKSKAACP